MCNQALRAGKTCGRPADHDGQHRTARAMNKRNVRKRLDTEQAAILRDLAGIKDGRKTRTMSAVEYCRSIGYDVDHSGDAYYARKRASGLIT
jgi:hypothetical protein